MIDGKVSLVAPDLNELKEFDWDAPENQEWIESEDKRLREKYYGMSLKDLDEVMSLKETIKLRTPELSMKEAGDLALKEYRDRKGI